MPLPIKKIILGIAAVSLLLTGGLLFFRGSWKNLVSKSAVVATKKLCSPPWSCGHLAKGAAGMNHDGWYLAYDDVTGPAQLEVIFTKNATCRVDEKSAPCDRLFPPSGTAASFKGEKNGGTFLVSSLDFVTTK